MCGITGVVQLRRSRERVDPALLSCMRDTMTHRGPDDDGLYLNERKTVGLGFRRLSIVDLSPAGHQPMSNEDGTVWIVFNGEIYNHRDLRPELERRGHRYRSQSDTETILHAYEEYGLDCLDRLHGMFAFAIWDERKQQLFFARDRLGKKPFYYTTTGDTFRFASEIKAILADPRVRRDVNEEALYHYLSFLVTPAPQTLFAGISKLPAGWAGTLDQKTGKLTTWQYWDAIVQRPEHWRRDYFDEGWLIEQIRRHLSDSVQRRMMSDVPIGVFLSGGIDSSTNVHYFKEFATGPVKTFCVGFEDHQQYNEFEYARLVAKRYGTEHHEILINQHDCAAYLPKMVQSQDEPISDPVNIPLYFVSKLIRDSGVIVAQVGEGSDELFSGYSGYLQIANLYLDRWRYLQQIPALLRQLLYRGGRWWFGRRGTDLGIEYLRRLAHDEPIFWGGAVTFTEWDKARLIDPAFRARLTTRSSLEVIQPYYDAIAQQKPESDFLERMIYVELKLRLAELLLMRVDKITASVSIESRTPFLDHQLVELAMNIPWQMKIKGRTPKYILKKAVEGLIPHEIIYRKKMGFGAPIREWFLKELGETLEETLLTSGIRERGYFDYDHVRELIDRHRSGRGDTSFQLWTLFNLSLWYDHWIAGAR
ncbi:asparagine synthase (glutamine-hydrolyzing) [Candidatus Berkelbacteria bacterium]|nr:asparagine synthase (glutamine-hydrolyzing) [Candidatus Berkelbacteria bacterium]